MQVLCAKFLSKIIAHTKGQGTEQKTVVLTLDGIALPALVSDANQTQVI